MHGDGYSTGAQDTSVSRASGVLCTIMVVVVEVEVN